MTLKRFLTQDLVENQEAIYNGSMVDAAIKREAHLILLSSDQDVASMTSWRPDKTQICPEAAWTACNYLYECSDLTLRHAEHNHPPSHLCVLEAARKAEGVNLNCAGQEFSTKLLTRSKLMNRGKCSSSRRPKCAGSFFCHMTRSVLLTSTSSLSRSLFFAFASSWISTGERDAAPNDSTRSAKYSSTLYASALDLVTKSWRGFGVWLGWAVHAFSM